MQCNSCGASIPAGAKHCPLCGAPVFTPGPYQESVSLPPPSPPDGNTWANSYNSRPFSEMPPPTSPNSPPDWMMAPGSYNPSPPAGSPPNAYGQPAYTPYYASTQQPPYTMPQPPLPPPLQQRPPGGR